MPLNEKDVLDAIAELVDPVTDRNFVESKCVKNEIGRASCRERV